MPWVKGLPMVGRYQGTF